MTTATPSAVPKSKPTHADRGKTAPGQAPKVNGLLDKHHFLLRRLHSLTGIVPVGVFVVFHLFTNMQMALAQITGELHYFQDEVDFIHSLPALLFLEIFGLWLPIAFHAGLGVLYMIGGKSNFYSYRYGGNIRYTLQRWTAWIALFFIFFHVASLRWGWTFGVFEFPFIANAEGEAFAASEFALAAGIDSYPLATATTAIALQSGWLDGWLVTLAYLVGSLAIVYHWSNGLWTAAITWGLTLTQKAMHRWGMVCIAMGLALTLFSISAIWGARAYEVTDQDRAALKAYAAESKPQAKP